MYTLLGTTESDSNTMVDLHHRPKLCVFVLYLCIKFYTVVLKCAFCHCEVGQPVMVSESLQDQVIPAVTGPLEKASIVQ